MSTVDDDRLRKLEQALTHAHRARHSPPWQAGWDESVMQEIRRVSKRQAPFFPNGDVTRLVWRTAGFAAILSILLMVSFLIRSTMAVSGGGGLIAEDIEVGSLFFE